MRQKLIGQAHEQTAAHKADHGREPGDLTHLFRHINTGIEQRPEARRDHDTGGKAKHHIEDLGINVLLHEDQGGTGSGHRPGKQRCQKGLHDRV